MHCTTRGMRAHAVQHCARAALPSGPCEPHCTKLHDMHVAITGFTGAHNLQIRFVPAQTLLKSDGSDAGAPLGSKVVGSASLELAAREPESTTTAPPPTLPHRHRTDTMVRQVQPLRISKSTPTASPDKQVAMSRPLAEISSGSTRRNSPSYNQSTRACPSVSSHRLAFANVHLPENLASTRAFALQRELFPFAITHKALTT